MYLYNVARFCQILLVSSGITRAQKSILTIRFLMVISHYFTVLVLDGQYWVSDRIVTESICLKFSRGQARLYLTNTIAFYPKIFWAIGFFNEAGTLESSSILIYSHSKTDLYTQLDYWATD